MCRLGAMPERIHLVLSAAEKERYRRAAARVGQSLSEWLRQAAEERAAVEEEAAGLESADELHAFFAACDARPWPRPAPVVHCTT